MLARSPFGGSLVILSEFCSTLTGKCALGAAVSHSRKSACVRSDAISSHIFSRLGIHEGARWQFCKTTQPPAGSACAPRGRQLVCQTASALEQICAHSSAPACVK
eukprot:2435809-Pleurochrysis_carterae.AAC.2